MPKNEEDIQQLESGKADRLGSSKRTFPRPGDGNNGDTRIVVDSDAAGTRYFCFKSDGTWYKIAATEV